MSFLSFLFGCKPASLQGPNFNQTFPKVLHIKPGITVTYEMPSNMSNLMNFAQRYAEESPSTIIFNTAEIQRYEKWHWRAAKKLDGAMWDYAIKGDADLKVRIDVTVKPSPDDLQVVIQSLYEEFYNGEDGLNTRFRKSRPNRSDEEFGSWIKPVPNNFRETSINGVNVLTWSEEGRDTGREAQYYALEIQGQFFLTFAFLYTISTNSEKEQESIRKRIPNDIDEFMKRIHITQH